MAVAASFHVEKVESAVRTFSHDVRAGGIKVSYALQQPSRGVNVAVSSRWNYSGLRDAMNEFEAVKSSKRSGYAPVKQGVLELKPNSLAENLRITEEFAARYAKLTGHTILGVAVHHDEGHIEDGREVIHYHAHIVFDRRDLTTPQKKIIDTNANDMRKVQNLAAEVTGLPRGKPAQETKRVHLSVVEWRRMKQEAAERNVVAKREVAELHAQALASAQAEAAAATAAKEAAQRDAESAKREAAAARSETKKAKASSAKSSEEVAALKAQYTKLREEMKASGAATQSDYMALKKKFDEASKERDTARAAAQEFEALSDKWKAATKLAKEEAAAATLAAEEAKALAAAQAEAAASSATKLKVAEMELSKSTQEIVELEEELSETKLHLSAAQNEIKTLDLERAQYKNAADNFVQELREIHEALADEAAQVGVDVAEVNQKTWAANAAELGPSAPMSWKRMILALAGAIRDFFRGPLPDYER